MSVIIVHTVFSAITILQEMEFARRRYDKEEGRVEWRNMYGDRAEIIVDRQLNCCKIDIYDCSYNEAFRAKTTKPIYNNGGKKTKMNGKDKKPTSPPPMNGKDTKPTSPPPNLSDRDKAWKELEQLWKDSSFSPQDDKK